MNKTTGMQDAIGSKINALKEAQDRSDAKAVLDRTNEGMISESVFWQEAYAKLARNKKEKKP
jgi:hypothetical protein